MRTLVLCLLLIATADVASGQERYQGPDEPDLTKRRTFGAWLLLCDVDRMRDQYECRLRLVLREPLLLVSGAVSRREGTLNIVVSGARSIRSPGDLPVAKNWH